MEEKITRKVKYLYDDLHRLVGVSYGDDTIIRYAYDAVGNLIAVENKKNPLEIKKELVCPQCQNQANPGAKFCGNCGSPLSVN